MKKLAMKMLSLLLVLSLLLPTCVFAQPGQDGDGTPGTQGAAMENADTPTGGGNSDGDADAPTGGGNGDENTKDVNGDGNTKDVNGDGNTKDVNGGSVTQSTTSEKTTTFTEGEDGDTPTEEPIVATVSIAVAAEDDDDDFSQEELLEGYLYSISGLYGEGAAVFRAPSKPLPVETQHVYDELQPMVLGVANGTGTTTEFAITKAWTKDRGASGWGIPDGDTIFTTNAEGKTVLTDAASEAIGKFLDVDALMQRMLSTMPYELYWFDKTGGHGMQVTYGASLSGSDLTVSGLKISMWVAQTYATHNGDGTYNPFTPNTTVTGATSTAVNNAKQIVTDNSGKSDYEKLKAYLSEICNRVEYNHAAGSSYTGGYGDPWQLIYVFDNDTTNKVVCEGYAKAFKYLCDLTWTGTGTGTSPAVECYLVTGTMKGGTGAGPHMWNIVRIGGNNYLVDVTNCDSGTIGVPNLLFLCGVEENDPSKKYTATNTTAGVSPDVSYEYDTQTMSDYTADELKLSGEKYDPNAKKTPVITTPPTASGITYGETLNDSTISSGVAKVDGVAVSGAFAWRDTTIAPEVKDSETTGYEVVFTPTDTASYENATCNVTLTVNAKNLTDVAVGTIADQGYTGGQIKPAVTVTGDSGKTLVKDKDYTVDYSANNTVGTTAGSVTVKAKPGGNYTFGDKTVNFTIVAGTSTISITGNPSKTYDGNAVTDPSVNTTGSTGTVSFTYYTDAICATETTNANSGAASDGAAPKNAGDYWVKATVAADSNYGAATSDAKKFTISQKALTNSMITLGTQATYDGSAHGPVYSVKDGITVLKKGTDYIETSGFNPLTNVVNMTLGISGAGNYKGEASVDWSLKAEELTLPSAAAVNKPYDGNNAATVNGGALSGVVGSDDVALAAGSVGGTFSSRYAGTNINVTAEAFALTGTKAGNYTLTQPTGLKADITAADQNPTIIGTATLAKGGSELDLSTLVNGAMGDVSFSISSGTSSATLSVTTLKSTDTTGVVKIDVSITQRSVGGDGTPEYKAYAKTGAITVTVADKTSAPLVGGVTQSGCTYGETLANPVFTKPTGTTITTYFYEGTLTKDGSYYTGLSKPTEAGNYMVKVTCETATHIYMGTALFTIEQKDISGMDVTLSKSTTPYTGSSQSVTVSSVGTLILGEYTVGGTTSGTQAGTYTVTVTGHGNYKGTADKTWEIKKATLTITGATVVAKTYDGTDGATVSSVAFSGLASSDTLTRGTDYDVSGVFNSANVSSANKVTVTVTLKDTATAKNYELASATYDVTGQSIAQATTPAAPTGLTGVKGNALSTVTLRDGWTWVNGSTVMNTVGSQTFKANYNDAAGNYASATNVDVAVNVMNKTDVGGKISFNDGTLVYTGAGQRYETASISGITAGTGVTWTYGYTAGTGTLDSGLPKTVGTYTVTVTYEDSLNYGTKSVTLTIAQATPTGAPKFTKITSSGKTLGDAALVKTVSGSGDGFSVAGTVEWVDGSGTALADSTSVEANKSYGWKFTPTDSNYKSISGSVVVYTVRRVSHSGGAAADSAAAAAAQPTVYSGSRGESVKTLQERLNAKGYNAGSVDGIFGKNTQAAVMAFQKANGLAADGIVGKLTWAKLYDTTAALPSASTATGTQPMVYRGSRGDAVRRLQELLNKKGFDCGAVDGIFGSKTYAAVVAFQKANGLGADGIVGPLTWGKLG